MPLDVVKRGLHTSWDGPQNVKPLHILPTDDGQSSNFAKMVGKIKIFAQVDAIQISPNMESLMRRSFNSFTGVFHTPRGIPRITLIRIGASEGLGMSLNT